MKVVARTGCDVVIDGRTVALYAGQAYDLPDAYAKRLIAAGHVDAIGKKSVSGPPSDKAGGRRRGRK